MSSSLQAYPTNIQLSNIYVYISIYCIVLYFILFYFILLYCIVCKNTIRPAQALAMGPKHEINLFIAAGKTKEFRQIRSIQMIVLLFLFKFFSFFLIFGLDFDSVRVRFRFQFQYQVNSF